MHVKALSRSTEDLNQGRCLVDDVVSGGLHDFVCVSVCYQAKEDFLCRPLRYGTVVARGNLSPQNIVILKHCMLQIFSR